MSRTTTKLFVGNLPDGCNREELQAKFEKYGNVAEFDIISNYGFVHYQNPTEAQAAADALNGSSFMGKSIRVEMSTSKVRQKPGMGESDGCYRCGKPGHWSKSCPRGPRRPMPPRGPFDRDPYSDPYFEEPFADPYLRDRYPPPPLRYDPYFDSYDRRPGPPPPRDPYRDPYADPYARPVPDYYRRSPPQSAIGRPPLPGDASSNDPFGKDPLLSRPPADPYATPKPAGMTGTYASAAAANPYAASRTADPYAASRTADPYAASRTADPYAASRTADPYGTRADPYSASNRMPDPYTTNPYGAPGSRPSDPYSTNQTSSASSNMYSGDLYGASTGASQNPYTGNSKDPYENYYDRKTQASSMMSGYQAVSQARVPGPY